MNNNSKSEAHQQFPYFRIGRSKTAVDISVPTIRKFLKMGLKSYKIGKSRFISREDLSAFIRAFAEPQMGE